MFGRCPCSGSRDDLTPALENYKWHPTYVGQSIGQAADRNPWSRIPFCSIWKQPTSRKRSEKLGVLLVPGDLGTEALLLRNAEVLDYILSLFSRQRKPLIGLL
jgi:hypothetical protein